jgi:hypothetical protein
MKGLVIDGESDVGLLGWFAWELSLFVGRKGTTWVGSGELCNNSIGFSLNDKWFVQRKFQ